MLYFLKEIGVLALKLKAIVFAPSFGHGKSGVEFQSHSVPPDDYGYIIEKYLSS